MLPFFLVLKGPHIRVDTVVKHSFLVANTELLVLALACSLEDEGDYYVESLLDWSS